MVTVWGTADMLRSLQGRLGLSLAVVLLLLWGAATLVTTLQVRSEINTVFDSALQETAQRILPLAVADILSRDDTGVTRRLATIRSHSEVLTYLVRDPHGRILLHSHDAEPALFPAWDGPGFSQTATHRIYNEDTLQGTIRLTLAEPLTHRQTVIEGVRMSLGVPILILMPAVLLAVVLVVRVSLLPLQRFRHTLALRDAQDMSQLSTEGLPSELIPVTHTLNTLLGRLAAAFVAERSFTANAAHELRTPLAGAIAQLQRLSIESQESATQQRAHAIEATLKRLTVLSERLMQLARAEGSQLRLNQSADLLPVARLLSADLARNLAPERIRLQLPAQPLLSDLDPDVFAIVLRNLLENALRHGTPATPVVVTLEGDGTLVVSNDCPLIDSSQLAQLTQRFERGGATASGSGLGLAIVQAICLRIGSPLELRSPASGKRSGFEVRLQLPVTVPPAEAGRTAS